ncbi:unnamed protein product [Mycena citricolor]|uniref:Uncharacterized protein n=1 Tax=Mycena citricolor TaxID=2018698 RepID=A0AAD2GSY9_9AGAR|nr:unnamed protein product [Mycena citricolor]
MSSIPSTIGADALALMRRASPPSAGIMSAGSTSESVSASAMHQYRICGFGQARRTSPHRDNRGTHCRRMPHVRRDEDPFDCGRGHRPIRVFEGWVGGGGRDVQARGRGQNTDEFGENLHWSAIANPAHVVYRGRHVVRGRAREKHGRESRSL